MNQCPECGAHYATETDSCATRFERLLALDHSRQEPWGSRHGLAFAVFALQHPIRYPASLDRAWEALYRTYAFGELAAEVFADLRGVSRGKASPSTAPGRPPKALSTPAVTIADLGDFVPSEYPRALDRWCRATLRAWGVDIPVDAA